MIKYIQLFLLFFALQSLAQKDTVFMRYNSGTNPDKVTYTTDTVLFETPMGRHILTGTTILPWTHHQQQAKAYGIFLDKVTKSDCKKDATAERIPAKINHIINKTDELHIDINISDNCCYSFLCDIEIVNESTINLIYYGYGTYCDCDCCFGLTYKFKKDTDFDSKKIKAVMINGLKQTLQPIKNTQ